MLMRKLLLKTSLILLTLLTVSFSSSPAFAISEAPHEMQHMNHASIEMNHEHLRDCAAACGVTERSENKRIHIGEKKKEKEKQFDVEPRPPNTDNFPDVNQKYQTVFQPEKNDTYLRYSLLRL